MFRRVGHQGCILLFSFCATSTATNRTANNRGLWPGTQHPPARRRSGVSFLLVISIYPGFRIHTDKMWPFDGPIGFALVHFFNVRSGVIGAISDALMTFLCLLYKFGRATDNLRYFNGLACLAEWLTDRSMGCFCDLLHAKRPCTQNSPGAWRS